MQKVQINQSYISGKCFLHACVMRLVDLLTVHMGLEGGAKLERCVHILRSALCLLWYFVLLCISRVLTCTVI